MEIIKKIEKIEDFRLEESDYWGNYDGFKITTDKQEILFGICNEQDCCEDFGYFISEDDVSDFIGTELRSIDLVDTSCNVKQYESHIGEYGLDEGDVMFVNINTTNGMFQLTAYNAHNGYYGHDAVIISNQLTKSEIL